MTARERRRARLVAGAALAGGLVAVLLVRGGHDQAGAPATASARPRPLAAEPPPGAPEPRTPATIPSAFSAPAVRVERERASLPPQALARSAMDDYRRRARYPRSSHPLEPGEDPIARDREVTPVTDRGPSGDDVALTVFPLRVSFEAPEPAVLLAYLSVGERRIAAREMRATVTTEDLTPIAELVYNDDGREGDIEAGDGLYTASVLPAAADPSPVRARSYLVKVRAAALGDIERAAATSFLYSAPDARVTGRYRDALVGGNLALEVEVEVSAAGRFHLEATLYDAGGSTSLAWAQTAAVLEPGLHWMTLPFYGLILHEKGIDGPYLVRYLALSTATDMPNAKNDVLENAHVTRSYAATAFGDQPYDDPELLDAAERAERDRADLGGLEAES